MPPPPNPLTRFRRLVIDHWTPSNAYGFGPNVSDSDQVVDIHTSDTDDSNSDPQIALEIVDETPERSGVKATGAGWVFDWDGLMQARCVAGTDDAIPADVTVDGYKVEPSSVARALASEVARIWHAHASTGVTDSTGNPVFVELEPGQRRGPMTDDDATEDRFYAVQELLYDFTEDPP